MIRYRKVGRHSTDTERIWISNPGRSH